MTSLGLFIIDENQYPESWNRKPEFDIIGGGLSYALIGARIVSGSKYAADISGIVDMGTDFPIELKHQIESWGTGVKFRANPDRLTSRGVNIYRENGVREFKYRSPKRRILGQDIIENPPLSALRTFHFCCAMDRCESTIDSFVSLAEAEGRLKPKLIFEPFPDVCIALNFSQLKQMLHKVDVFSPNLHEALCFLDMETVVPTELVIRQIAETFFAFQDENSGILLRCGELGCYVKSSTVSVMIPAFHTDQSKVVDVTGGGNCFCGAFITSFELTGDWIFSAILATIASGIVIEQLGMPCLDHNKWNGNSVDDRLNNYLSSNPHLDSLIDKSVLTWI